MATATLEATSDTPIIKIPAGGVNVRSGPGLSFDLLGRLLKTVRPTLSANETGEWWQIEYEKRRGWARLGG